MIRFTRATIFLALFTCTLIAASQEQQPQQPTQGQPSPPQHHKSAHPRPAAAKADDDSAAQEPSPNPRADVIRENNFGVSLMNRQQFEKALGKFQRACILDPQTDIGCLNSGIALLNMQRFDEAREILQKSAQRDPRNPWAWFNLGLMEKAGGDADAAITDFQKVAALDPYDADTQYFLGLIYSQQQQYDKAIAAFKRALVLNPFQVSAEFGMAQALQRSGKTSEAKIHFDRFQHMTSQKLGKPVSFIYGEQGKYSLAEIMQPAPEPVPQAMPVHFVNVTAAANLPSNVAAVATAQLSGAADTTPSASATATLSVRKTRNQRRAAQNPAATLAEFLGSGACIIDYNSDGKPDIFLADADGRGNSALYKNLGAGKFLIVTREAHLEIHGHQMGCAVGDYDNDGKPDLAVSTDGKVILFHNEGNGTFKDVTKDAGIDTEATEGALALGLTFIDFDHDGDLDLYVTRFNDFPLANPAAPFDFPTDAPPPGNVLWRNNGNGTFTNWTTETALAGTAPSVGALASDINNDRAIDFVVTGWQKSPVAYLNPREGAFQSTTPWSSDMPAPTVGVAALDFNKDGWMDLAFTHWGAPGLSLWRNNNGKSFERVNLPDLDWMRGWGVAPIDYDDDGWIDLVAVGEDFSGDGHIVLLRNEGAAGFRDVTASTGLDKIALRNPRAIIAFDFDGDGATDLLITQNNLPPVLLKNDGGNRYNWIKIALKGENDNKSAIGTKVELYAGALQQKWEVPGASGYLGQGPAPIVAGLGAERQADVIRLLWP
ncbi:MAG: FG-GAP-like repeat-containing protein, partial [Candidatus Acidiferrales bacterium]